MRNELLELLEMLPTELHPIYQMRLELLKRIIDIVSKSKVATALEADLQEGYKAYDRSVHAQAVKHSRW